jgi:hypothetical protein
MNVHDYTERYWGHDFGITWHADVHEYRGHIFGAHFEAGDIVKVRRGVLQLTSVRWAGPNPGDQWFIIAKVVICPSCRKTNCRGAVTQAKDDCHGGVTLGPDGIEAEVS